MNAVADHEADSLVVRSPRTMEHLEAMLHAR